MRLHAGSLALFLSSLAVSATGPVAVGPNVQVSRANERVAHNEILLAADPVDAGRLLGCSMAFDPERNRIYTIVYASSDGGKSWTPTLDTADYAFSGDPACALGRNARAYFMALGWKEDSKGSDDPIYRSEDSGRSWKPPLVLRGFHGLDREYLVVDNTGGKFDGRVYMHATGWVRPMEGKTKQADLSLFTSRDGGASFLGPVKRASAGKRYVLGVGNSVVLSDGTLIMVFGEINRYWNDEGEDGEVPESTSEKPNGALKVLTSTDGGESLETASVVSPFYMLWPPFSTSMIGYVAVDPGSAAFKDRVYAVWPDQRSGRQEILLSHSEDKAKTWSKPILVSDDPAPADRASARDHLMPTVAVNREGVVVVVWYDRRDNPDNLGWWVRLRASLDGGETFLPSVRVSESPTAFGASERWTVQGSTSGGGKKPPGESDAKAPGGPISVNLGLNGFQFNGGHTGATVADAAGAFHPFWIDNRTGTAQIWTAAVTVSGAAVKNGSPALAAFDDVSDKVALEVTSTDYDRKTDRLSVRVRLKNTSDRTIEGPVRIRLISMSSELGRPQALDTENGISGAGAVWDLTTALPDGILKPGQETAARRLEFHLTDLRPFRQGKTIRYGLVSLDARVLGKLAAAPEAGKPGGKS